MSNRRRLSIEPLEDRTNPASVSDLQSHAIATYMTTLTLKDFMDRADEAPVLNNTNGKAFLKSFFTNVYVQAQETLLLAKQFPGSAIGAQAKPLAQLNRSFALQIGNLLGFDVKAPTSTPNKPTPGAANAAHSVVSVSPASIVTGGTATVTFRARDVNGTPLTTGGATIVFSLGTGTGQGTFGTVTDNHNGTYTSTFTGTTAGINTIKATLNGTAVTTTAPTITITAGVADRTKSTVTRTPASVAIGGTSTVTLTARNSAGIALTTGGATVTFALGTGAGQGTFSTITDNNNGTYTATFTGTVVGANTITATLNGQAVTTTAPTITVVGAASPLQSIVTRNPASIVSGGTSTVTLTAKDANGNQLPTGGATVLFSLGNGTGQGTFGSVTDNNNGTYTATFTGTTVGTNTITATFNGTPLTSTAPTITITTAPDLAQSTVTAAPTSIVSGNTSTVTLTARDAGGTQLTTGGLTVVFSLGNGTGQGTFGGVTDNGNGTYTATFTGTTAGTNTITATVNSQPLTSTPANITVTTGAASLSQSIVTRSPASVTIGGTSTITLTAKDAAGNQLTTGGATVVFSLGTGTGQGTFGSVTDNANGTYTATFTGITIGPNTIKATFNGQALTSTAPTITVTAAASLSQSSVTASPTSIQSGNTSTVTLTARDAGGTQLTTGGLTVAFSLGNGTGQGTFGGVIDNGNGTYIAVFTGTTAGANTITATINGQALTSTAANITVTASASLSQSGVTAAPTSIQSGNASTVTLTARDAAGTQLTTGGLTVVFSLGNGTGQGTFGTVTDNANGTYSATFTGTIAGSNTITATINAQALTSTPANMTVTPGAASLSQSTVTPSPTSVSVGGTSIVTLTAKDAAGNQLTTGGATVLFSLGNGTGQGTFGSVIDNADGTYTATFTGTTAGTNTVTATFNAQALTSTAPTITVNEVADLAQSSVSAAPTSIVSGTTSTITLTARNAAGTQLTSGGATVAFTLGNGTGQGTFSTVTDNGNGTYTATFTGTIAGTNTITATINAQALTSTPANITVTPGSASLSQSQVSIAPTSIPNTTTATITLTAKDAAGNTLTTGGSTVLFTLGNGTALGTIGTVTDNNDGSYTATFTATGAGTNTISSTIGGQNVTSTAPTFTVT